MDKPFLSKVFQMIAAGEMGKLDKDRVVIRGWSGGAQMVSWLMQVIATNKTFGDTMTMKGGVMMSGGSYNCCTRAPPVPPICRPLADHNSLVSCQSPFPKLTLLVLIVPCLRADNDPQDPTHPIPTPVPTGSCQGCTEGGPNHCAGDPKCSSCDPSVKTYCQQCCPRNYTEQYYVDNPSEYAKHPPIFLGQTSKTDNHAGSCILHVAPEYVFSPC